MGDRELSLDEMNQASGGAINPSLCLHPMKTYTGEKREENGKYLFGYNCSLCGTLFWTEEPPHETELIR